MPGPRRRSAARPAVPRAPATSRRSSSASTSAASSSARSAGGRGLGAQAAQRARRHLRPALGDAQPREPGLRLHAQRVGPAVRVLGLDVGAHEPVQLAELVGGLAGCRAAQQLPRRSAASASAPAQFAAEGRHLRAVDQARPAVRDQVGAGGAPAVQGRRPGPRPDDVAQHHAGRDGEAVAEADHGGGRLVRRDGEHDLVEHVDGLGALPGTSSANPIDSRHRTTASASPAASPRRSPSRAVTRASATRRPSTSSVRAVGEQPPGLAAAGIVLLDQPLGAGRPGAGPHRLPGVLQDESARHRAAGGGAEVARLEEQLVGAPERRHRLLVRADQVRRPPEQHEAVAVQRSCRSAASSSTQRRHWKVANSSRASARTEPSPSGGAMGRR